MLKMMRQIRKEKLVKCGFCKFEASTLSVIPFRVPYMKELVKARKNALAKSVKNGISRTQFEKSIKADYVANNWIKHYKVRKIADAWQMLRAFEDQYKMKFPEYQSPWKKSKRNFKDFIPKVKKTINNKHS